ncbi:MAG: BrnA antitoxin family protein [Paracoccaceae bacterium]|nr:BrnA antitoxin family protein [Paracoccaceae bacterium]
MKEADVTTMSLSETLLWRGEDSTDWSEVLRHEIEGEVPELGPDEGEFDEFITRIAAPRRKQAISPWLDRDILEFFDAHGRGYQACINAALRLHVNCCRKAERQRSFPPERRPNSDHDSDDAALGRDRLQFMRSLFGGRAFSKRFRHGWKTGASRKSHGRVP